MGADRFAHLMGQRGQETTLNHLRTQNQVLQGEIQRLNNELFNRATPTISNFCDGLRTLSALAAQGNKQALSQVELVVQTLAIAREVVRKSKSRIELPDGAKVPDLPEDEDDEPSNVTELEVARAGGS